MLLQEATEPANVERLAARTGMARVAGAGRAVARLSEPPPVALAEWTRPRVSRHAFIEVVPAGRRARVRRAPERGARGMDGARRVFELRALLRSVARHSDGSHVLVGDFNTLAPGELLDFRKLPRGCGRSCG